MVYWDQCYIKIMETYNLRNYKFAKLLDAAPTSTPSKRCLGLQTVINNLISSLLETYWPLLFSLSLSEQSLSYLQVFALDSHWQQPCFFKHSAINTDSPVPAISNAVLILAIHGFHTCATDNSDDKTSTIQNLVGMTHIFTATEETAESGQQQI